MKLGRLLCWLGRHEWLDSHHCDLCDFFEGMQECSRCGKIKGAEQQTAPRLRYPTFADLPAPSGVSPKPRWPW